MQTSTQTMNKLWSLFHQLNEYPEFYLGKLNIIHREPRKIITVFHKEILSWEKVRN
jgi:hypothetical protein